MRYLDPMDDCFSIDVIHLDVDNCYKRLEDPMEAFLLSEVTKEEEEERV